MSVEPIRPLLPLSICAIEAEYIDPEPEWEDLNLPIILIESEATVVDQVIGLLAQRCPALFSRNGMLVRLVFPEKTGIISASVQIEDVSPAWLRDQISRIVRFQREVGGDLRNLLVPEWLPTLILARKDYPGVRPLLAVVEVPVFLGDGRIHDTEGYDSESAIYLHPLHGKVEVPEAPTKRDAVEAMGELAEVFQDFPYARDPSPSAHCAATLATILGIVGRFAVDGPTPFTAIEACSQGSGKGLQVHAIHLIATGRAAGVLPCSGDQEELRRSLLPALRAAQRVGWLDEIPSPFGGPFWNLLVTAWPTYADRVIRTSSSVRIPALTYWVVSANNIQMKPDTTRRALVIRLEPEEERPEGRTGFAHPDLLAWVREHQPRLLGAALTILKAYHIAGRPRIIQEPVGSFESWDSLIRQAIAWVTGEDPMAPKHVLAELLDHRRSAWRDLVEGLWEVFGAREFVAKDAIEAISGAKGTEASRQATEELLGGKPATVGSFGRTVLAAHRGVIAGGVSLRVVKAHSNRGAVYQLRRARDG